MSESPRRSALVFALDVTGGQDVVYRVAVYLQDLFQRLDAAPGLTNRTRIDVLFFDAQSAQIAPLDRFLSMAAQAASQQRTMGSSIKTLVQQLQTLPFEGGGFHVFVALTSNPVGDVASDIQALRGYVASVTGLCCGPFCAPESAAALSKEPGGTRIVNPLDVIRIQFDSIANWLIANFADKPTYIEDDIGMRPTIRYPQPQTQPTNVFTHMATPNFAVSQPIPTPPEPVPPDPPVIAPAKWRVLEPKDRTDATEHLVTGYATGQNGWRMIGASRRGKLHAHEGTYRDDAFAITSHNNWNLVAVADGAGSCRLSRVGAHIGCDAALEGMKRGIDTYNGVMPENKNDALRAIGSIGIQAAHQAVYDEARRRAIPVRDLSSTLLLYAHRPESSDGPAVLLMGQIGDGLGLLVAEDLSIQVIGTADKGYYSGETLFLPATKPEDWDNHVSIHPLPEVPKMMLLMTDGIADDLVPYARQAPTLINGLLHVLVDRQPEKQLLETIGYDKRDSADDRTLVVLYHKG